MFCLRKTAIFTNIAPMMFILLSKFDKWSIFKVEVGGTKILFAESVGESVGGFSGGLSLPGRPAHTLTYPWPAKIPCQLRSPKDIINPKIIIFWEKIILLLFFLKNSLTSSNFLEFPQFRENSVNISATKKLIVAKIQRIISNNEWTISKNPDNYSSNLCKTLQTMSHFENGAV